MRLKSCLMAAAVVCALSGTVEAKGPFRRLAEKVFGRSTCPQYQSCPSAAVPAPTIYGPSSMPTVVRQPSIVAGFSAPTCSGPTCPKR